MTEKENLKLTLGATAKNLNINKKWRFVKRDVSNNTVNYAGHFVPIVLIDETNKEEYSILIKFPPDWPLKSLVDRIFSTEFQVYSTLLPVFRSLKSKTDMENLFPNCYYALNDPDNKVLVLQDMTSKGFERKRCGNNLNYRHMKVALEAISKFHALSFMTTENKDLQMFSREYPKGLSTTLNKGMDRVLPILKNKHYSELLQKYCADFEKNMEECVLNAKGQVNGHGDFWKENILFKYSNDIPIEACLIDFQQTRKMNIAQDILFFITTSSDETVRKMHLNDLLNYYYRSLQELLIRNGLNGAKLYSEEDFHYDLILVFPVCLVLTVFSFSLWSGVIKDIDCLFSDIIRPIDDKAATTFIKMVDHLISDFIHFGYIIAV